MGNVRPVINIAELLKTFNPRRYTPKTPCLDFFAQFGGNFSGSTRGKAVYAAFKELVEGVKMIPSPQVPKHHAYNEALAKCQSMPGLTLEGRRRLVVAGYPSVADHPLPTGVQGL